MRGKMRRGMLIVFEGLNGCGKGEQISRSTEYIYDLSRDRTIFRTREPNEFDTNGKMARQMLASDGDPYKNGMNAVEYFAKNRLTHCEIISGMQDKGIDVLCDRYYYSNLAYQNTQGIPLEKIAEANKYAIRPDLTFIIDVTAEEAAKRQSGRNGFKGRKFDSKIDFNQKVMNVYNELGEKLPDLMNDRSIHYIDGMKSKDDMWKEISKIYSKLL